MSKEAEVRELLFPQDREVEKEVDNEPETAELDAQQEDTTDALQEGQEVEATNTEEPTTEEVDEDIVTIKSLAADLEIEPETLYGMRVSVDGHDPMTISELKDLAMGTMDKREDTKEKEDSLAAKQAELDEREQRITQQAEGIAPQELVKAYSEIARVESEYAQVDWTRLEATNPGEAALQRQKMNEAYQIALYNKQQIEGRMETTRNEISQQREQATQAAQARAMETLHNLVPEWRDESQFKKDREHLVNRMVDNGVDEAVLRGITDPGLINYLHRSALRDEKIDAAQPRVNPPKVLKAAAVRQAGIGKVKADERFFKHAAKSKDPKLKHEAVKKLLGA